jgi:hypothetical protein
MHPWALSWSSAKLWSQVHGSVMLTESCYISLGESTFLEGPDGVFVLTWRGQDRSRGGGHRVNRRGRALISGKCKGLLCLLWEVVYVCSCKRLAPVSEMTLVIAGFRRKMFDLYRVAEARWRSVGFLMRCASAATSELANIPDHPQHGGVQGGSGSRSRDGGVERHGLALSV